MRRTGNPCVLGSEQVRLRPRPTSPQPRWRIQAIREEYLPLEQALPSAKRRISRGPPTADIPSPRRCGREIVAGVTPPGVTDPDRGRKSRLVSLLKPVLRRSTAGATEVRCPGVNGALVRPGDAPLDEEDRWQREPGTEQATVWPLRWEPRRIEDRELSEDRRLPNEMRSRAGWVRNQPRSIREAHTRA
jgi:hypothetical protein